MRRVGGLLLVVIVACAAMLGAAAGAGAAEPRPLSDGGLAFGTIHGPEDPEEYAFSVNLGEEQVLRPIDERTVGVFYPGQMLAFSISAAPAHDAQGASVPTTLAMTGPDTIVLTVHHRAGNPASGGAPFQYPVIGGQGWEGGFRTIVVPMENPSPPPAAQPAPTETTPPPAPERVLVTRALGEDKLYYRPHSFVLSADGTFGVGKAHWTSYGGATATATGRGSVNDCVPNCAAGRLSHPQATLRLSKLTSCQGGSVYARLSYALTGPLPKGFPRRGSFSMLPAGKDGKPDC